MFYCSLAEQNRSVSDLKNIIFDLNWFKESPVRDSTEALLLYFVYIFLDIIRMFLLW